MLNHVNLSCILSALYLLWLLGYCDCLYRFCEPGYLVAISSTQFPPSNNNINIKPMLMYALCNLSCIISKKWNNNKNLVLQVFIMGFGNIGIELAKRLRPFGVRILATKRNWASSVPNGFNSLGINNWHMIFISLLDVSIWLLLSVLRTNITKWEFGWRERFSWRYIWVCKDIWHSCLLLDDE